jgi:hypothetical protein
MRTDIIAHFADGSSSPVNFVGETVEYVDGCCYVFQTAIATRGDGKRRVLFVMPSSAEMEQADPWVTTLSRNPGMS